MKLNLISNMINKVYILGDGKDRNKVLNLLYDDKLDFELFCPGSVDDLSEYYLNSNIVLNTSRWEGLSLGVLEAMAYGNIPILTNVVGNRDIIRIFNDIDGSPFGYLFDEDNSDFVIQVISELFVDMDKLSSMSAMSRRVTFENYNESKMADSTMKAYFD